MTVGFRFSDIGEAYAVRLRRGVAEIEDRLPDKTDLTLTLDKATLNAIRSGRLALRDAIASGAIKLADGPPAAVERFFGYFEPPGGAIQLVMR